MSPYGAFRLLANIRFAVAQFPVDRSALPPFM
jgi:hypothetical protein